MPGYPVGGIFCYQNGVAEHLAQILEMVDPVEFTGVNETHPKIADLSAIEGAVEESVLSVENCLLDGSLTDIVVQRSPAVFEESSQPFPVSLKVSEGLT